MLNRSIINQFYCSTLRRRSQLIGKNIHKARLLVVNPPHHSCPRHWCRSLWQQIRSRACVLQTMRARTRACTYKHDKHTYRHTHTSAVTPTHVSAHTHGPGEDLWGTRVSRLGMRGSGPPVPPQPLRTCTFSFFWLAWFIAIALCVIPDARWLRRLRLALQTEKAKYQSRSGAQRARQRTHARQRSCCLPAPPCG